MLPAALPALEYDADAIPQPVESLEPVDPVVPPVTPTPTPTPIPDPVRCPRVLSRVPRCGSSRAFRPRLYSLDVPAPATPAPARCE